MLHEILPSHFGLLDVMLKMSIALKNGVALEKSIDVAHKNFNRDIFISLYW